MHLTFTTSSFATGARRGSLRRLKRLGFGLGCTVLLTGSYFSFSAWAWSESLAGQEAPDFSIEHAFNTDTSLSLRSLRGHPVLIFFSMYGCPNCEHWAPAISDLANERSPKGLTVLQLSSAGVAELYQEYGGEVAKNWIIANAGRSTLQAYVVRYVPRLLVIDGAGRVIFDESPNFWPFWSWRFNSRLHSALDKALSDGDQVASPWIRPGSSIGDAASFLATEKNRPIPAVPYGPAEFELFSRTLDTDDAVPDESRAALRLFYWMNRPTSEWAADMVAELRDPSVPDWPGCESVRMQATELLGPYLRDLQKRGPEYAMWLFEEYSHRVRRGDPSPRIRDNNLRSMRVAYERIRLEPHPPDFTETVIRETLAPALESEHDRYQRVQLIDAIYTLRFNLPFRELIRQKKIDLAYIDLGTERVYPYLTIARKEYPSSSVRHHYLNFLEKKVTLGSNVSLLLKDVESLGEHRAPTLEALQSVFARVQELPETPIAETLIARYLFVEYLGRNLRVYELTPEVRTWAALTLATLFLETTSDDWRYINDLVARLGEAGTQALQRLDSEIIQRVRSRLTTDPLLVGKGRVEADILLEMFQTTSSPTTSWSQRLYPNCKGTRCRIR